MRTCSKEAAPSNITSHGLELAVTAIARCHVPAAQAGWLLGLEGEDIDNRFRLARSRRHSSASGSRIQRRCSIARKKLAGSTDSSFCGEVEGM